MADFVRGRIQVAVDAEPALATVTEGLRQLMASNPVLRSIVGRRSRRKWLQRPVPDEAVLAILEAGRWAPSAGNFQPWHFVVATDHDSRSRITKVADESKNLSRIWAPYFREGARRGYLIDFTEVPLCIAIFADPRHAPPHVDGNLHHIVGAALALQNMWLAADALGLGACCWSNMQQDKMKAIFGVPHYFYFLAVLGIGYVDGDGSPDGYVIDESYWQRKPLADVVGWGWYRGKKGDAPPAAQRERLRRNLGL
jgi:5,6-dimethylbenzimidazole synthase